MQGTRKSRALFCFRASSERLRVAPCRLIAVAHQWSELMMKGLSFTLFCGAVLMTLAPPAMSHDCRVRDAYLRGAYEGDCDDGIELVQAKGEAKGADTYDGDFVKGRPTGKGVYTWENCARLDG